MARKILKATLFALAVAAVLLVLVASMAGMVMSGYVLAGVR